MKTNNNNIVYSNMACYTSVKKWRNVDKKNWENWQWQVRNTLKTVRELKEILGSISLAKEFEENSDGNKEFEMKLTPHAALNIYRAYKSKNYSGFRALIASFVPSRREMICRANNLDAIGEELESSKPAPLLTEFYKTRVLLFVTNNCPSHCRFCFRRRKIGNRVNKTFETTFDLMALDKAIDYLKKKKAIKEVIISGGDPLTLNDKKLSLLLGKIKTISNIKVVRINTKSLTILPQRITKDLIKILKKYQPIIIVGNFLHSIELTTETKNAISLLNNSGILVFSQTALIKGINDTPKIIRNLMWDLYLNRVIPYYLIQFIPTKWTEHFRVPIKKGLEIMEYLHGRLSGIANPAYIVYLPDGAGKVPILPNYLIKHTKKGYYFKNWEGKKVFYNEIYET